MVDDVHCSVLAGSLLGHMGHWSRGSRVLVLEWLLRLLFLAFHRFRNTSVFLVLLPSGAPSCQSKENEGQESTGKGNPGKNVGVVVFYRRPLVEEWFLVPGFSAIQVKIQVILFYVLIPMEENHTKQEEQSCQEGHNARNNKCLKLETDIYLIYFIIFYLTFKTSKCRNYMYYLL